MIYKNEEEAKTEFIRLNSGTPLLKEDEARTILTSLPNFDDVQMRIFSPLHNGMDKVIAMFVPGRGRKVSDEYLRRHNLVLFLRYVAKNDRNISFSTEKILEHDNKIIETKIVNYVLSTSINDVEKKLKDFLKFMEDQSANIKEIWDKIDKNGWPSGTQTATMACLRALLEYSIYRNINNIPVPDANELINKILMYSQGQTNVRVPGQRPIIMGLGKVLIFNKLADALGLKNHSRQNRNRSQIKPGYDLAHKKSFARNGEGDVVPLLSTVNKSNGILDLEFKE